MDIGKLIKSYHDMLLDIQEQKGSNGNVERIKRYKILHSFRGTYIEKQMQKEEKMINPIFRVFEPVKPSRGRKLNIDPEQDFDPYSDSLLDYPSIISYKFRKPWQQYNRLICLHIPLCPNDCWHCFVPKELYIINEKNNHFGDRTKLLTASEIIDYFIEQQRADGNEKPSNVLRITGGEPFLLPELILECLEELKKRELENKVFLWTETNLEPFVKKEGLNEGEEWEQREYNAFMDMDKNPEILTKLSEFNNLAVHPCFHGFDLIGNEFNLITGRQYNLTLREQISGLKKLVEVGIDVYPTIGTNICDPTHLENLFNGLFEIHRNLPLRLALVKYDIDYYEPVEGRLISDRKRRKPHIYSHYASLRIWNQLLLKYYGIGYGIIPRHMAPIKIQKQPISTISVESQTNQDLSPIAYEKKEILYLFKGSYRDTYHREILDIIALPSGHIYEINFDRKYVPGDLYLHMSKLPELYEKRKIVWIYVNGNRDNFIHLPIRESELIDISEGGDVISIKFKLGRYIYWEVTDLMDIKYILTTYFGERDLPPVGKYILIGEKLFNDENVDSNTDNDEIKFSSAFSEAKGKLYISDDFSVFRKIVQSISLAKYMKGSLFYRVIVHSKKIKQKNGDGNRTLYRIRGGKSFSIKIEFYLPNYSEFDEKNIEERTIHVVSSSKTITPIIQPKIVLSKYGSHEIHFHTSVIEREEEVTLTFFSEYAPFQAAKTELHIFVLPPSRGIQAGKSFLGAFFLTIATNGLALASQTVSSSQSIWNAFAKSFETLFLKGTLLLNFSFIFVIAVIFFLLLYFFPKGIPLKIK